MTYKFLRGSQEQFPPFDFGQGRKCVGIEFKNNDWWYVCDDGTKHSGAMRAAVAVANEHAKREANAWKWMVVDSRDLSVGKRLLWDVAWRVKCRMLRTVHRIHHLTRHMR